MKKITLLILLSLLSWCNYSHAAYPGSGHEDLHADECVPPIDLAVTGVTIDSATLAWADPSGATSWEVVVQGTGGTMPTGSGVATTNNTAYTVTELFDGTDMVIGTAYQYWVRTDCGNGGFSSWAGPYQFGTMMCPVEGQCTYTFTTWDVWNDSWGDMRMTVSQNGYAIGTFSQPSGGPQEFTIQVCGSQPVELYWNGALSNAEDVGVSISNSFGQTIFTKLPGAGTPDTIIFTGVVDCAMPACVVPDGLSAANIGTATADLSWNGPAGQWEYYIVPNGATMPTAANIGTPSSNPAIGAQFIAGGTGTLQPYTQYEYYVRRVCGGGTVTGWSEPYFFTTGICEPEDKCDYTFTMQSMWWSGWMGGALTIRQNGADIAVIGSEFTGGETMTVTVPLCDDIPFEIYWGSSGAAQEQMGVTVVNPFGQTVFTLPFNSTTAGYTIYQGYNDCDNPVCEPITGTYAQNSTMTSVEIGYDGPATGDWVYYVVPAGSPPPMLTTLGITATTNPVTISLPAPASNYDYYARRICAGGGSGQSSWSAPLPIHSEVCTEEDKCDFRFEMLSFEGYGGEGNYFTIYQAGVPVATFPDPDNIYWEGSSYTQVVPLCPDQSIQVYWNIAGLNDLEKGLVIYTPYLETLYTMDYGAYMPGLAVYNGTVSCEAPPCPQPQELTATNIGLMEATFNWTEMGDASEWAVWVVPYGTDAPLADSTPTFTTNENPVVYGNDAGEELVSATPYTFYVMALCGGDGNSPVSYPGSFVTGITNDDCLNATDLPVNPGYDCVQSVQGSLTGSTSSGVQGSCISYIPQADVWYRFTAVTANHSILLQNVVGDTYIAVYTDGCDGLTEVYCNWADSHDLYYLTVGTSYYIQVYSELPVSSAINSFDICVRTSEPAIIVSDVEYTHEELVTDILFGDDCIEISNITSLSGPDYGNPPGIGYFQRNGSNFPLEHGIILTPYDIYIAPADSHPLMVIQVGQDTDTDLTQVMNDHGFFPELVNATKLEFDLVAPADNISFDFVYASNLYGSSNCQLGDAFAIFISGPGITGQQNLAVVPGTDTPISYSTIRSNLYDIWCPSMNEPYFGTYNLADPISSGIHYSGNTVAMQAGTDNIIPGETYHIKMVIALDNNGTTLSAAFIGAPTFEIEPIDLGPDRLIATDNAICYGDEITINSNADEAAYNFVWYHNDEEIPGATTPSLLVNETVFPDGGTFSVRAYFEGADCFYREGFVKVEFYNDVEADAGEPINLTICDSDGFAEFDLASNTALILAGPGITDPADWTITYHVTQELAEQGLEPLDIPFTNMVQGGQQLFARIEHIAGCVGYETFWVRTGSSTTVVSITGDLNICSSTSATLTATVADNGTDVTDQMTYIWKKGEIPLPDTANSITVTQAGIYHVTASRGDNCDVTASVTVNVIQTPPADVLQSVTVCEGYTLPVLQNGAYYTAADGGGTQLSAGEEISTTQTIYIYAASGTVPNCVSQSSFAVTVVNPEFDLGGPYVFCDPADALITVDGNFDLDQATYIWRVNGVISDATGSSIEGTEFGTYEVTVAVNGCELTHAVEVTEGDGIPVLIKDYCENNIYMLEVSDVEGSFEPLTASYEWTGPNGFTGSTQAVAVASGGPGLYNAIIVTEEGCIGAATFDVVGTTCFIQRGISPNNDGNNEFFDLAQLEVGQLAIFNRYGLEVYSKGNYTTEWHGQTNNGDELPTGTYFYVIERANGEQATGWIYINREE